MRAFFAFFDIIPGAVYALLLALALMAAGAARMSALSAHAGKAQAEATLQRERAVHAAALAKETGAVLRLERELSTAKAAQEKRDAESKQVVDGLRADLRRKSRAGGGSGLRDPNAPRCDAAPGPAAASAPGGAGDAAEAGGLVSAELEGLLLRLTDEADAINIAYASCRADALSTRALVNQLSPSSAEPASQPLAQPD